MRLPKAEMERRLPADNAVSHFLAMMVRAPRAVDLLAKSALAVCSRDAGPGKPVLTQLENPLHRHLGG